MEQARLVLALVLSFLVFYIWNVVFMDKESPQKQKQHLNSEKTSQQAAKEKHAAPPIEKKEQTPLPVAVQPSRQERTPIIINVKSPLYSVSISEKGAAFIKFSLNQYREKAEHDSPPKELISEELIGGTVLTGMEKNSIPGMSDAVFSADTSSETLEIAEKPQKISFMWTSPEGIEIEKSFLFSPDTYSIKMTVNIHNRSVQEIRDNLMLSLRDLAPVAESSYGFEGPSAFLNNSLEQIKIKNIKDKNVYTGTLGWLALESRYFMSAVIPAIPENSGMNLSLSSDRKILETRYSCPSVLIQPGSSHAEEFTLFFGPKSLKVLKSLNNGLEKAVNFGMFDFIAKPCLWLMNFLYGFIPNYGVVIIILTILVKVLLWPLGTKSYKSMNDMKKLQPFIAELREKYKDDKAKMNQEMMNLYKIYKINPMGGCLPMVVQIPVFFALYRMLYEAIELRHAPFFGWIYDLSAPDRLFHFNFNFSVPFMHPPYGIPVLTLIMGATMLIQQKMSPPPGDPAQAKMMMLMPVVFTVIFINFSSGLVLYWLISNILSVAQQYYITKKYA